MGEAPHLPVLYETIITALQPKSSGLYIDGTLGAGGHSAGILEASAPDGQLLGLDLDPQALALAREAQDPGITAFLREHGRDGVPLYVFFPGKDVMGKEGKPKLLPQILTEGIVLSALG